MIYNNLNLYEFLTYNKNKKYNDIMKHMLFDDFYINQSKTYDIVKEIILDDEVVGIIVGEYYENNTIILKLCYILPSFRNKGLFVKELEFFEDTYDRVYLFLPNHFAINSLLRNNKAEFINEYIVKSDNKLIWFKEGFKEDEYVGSYYYDVRISACLDLLNARISPLQYVDVFCFNADYNRDKYYYDNIIKYYKDIYELIWKYDNLDEGCENIG